MNRKIEWLITIVDRGRGDKVAEVYQRHHVAVQLVDVYKRQALEAGQLSQLLPMLARLPEGTVQNAIQTAASAPDMALEQTASVFTKSFYVQLGADTDAMQTNYILMKGLEMLGFTVLLTACAIAAGFCLARMGAGVGRDLRRDVFRRVTYFTTGELDQFSTASLITRTTNDITQVQTFLSMGLRLMCFAPIMGIGGLIMGLSKCVSMAWILRCV